MSKVKSKLAIKETDKNALEDIVAGRTVAGEDIIIRARAILKMGEGHRLKDIAKELNIRPNTVTDIRKRYLKKGFDSIGDSSRSGRPVKVEDEVIAQSLDTIINNAQTSNLIIPSVKELSETLNAPEAKIRDYLKKKGIIQSRQNVWDFHTSKGIIAHWIDIVGLYISPDQQIIIVQTGIDDAGSTVSQSGKLIVHNRKLATEIRNALSDDGFIGLAKALEVFTNFSEKPDSIRAENALQYVQNVISGFTSTESGIEYHLIACGKQVIDTGRALIPGVYLHNADSLENWIAQVESIVNVLYQNGDNVETILGVCNGIERCLRLGQQMPDIFEWKKTSDHIKADVPNADDNHESAESEQSKIAPGTMRAICQVMGDDGQWIEATATSFCPVTQDEFDTSSTDAYLKSFHQIEQAAIAVTHEATRAFTENYLNEISKKKETKRG